MARNARFVVTLSGTSTNTVTVNYATVAGTAVSPDDFTPNSGTLTFAPGETSKIINVTIRDVVPDSAAEQFTVVLSNPTNATISDGTGVCLFAGNTTEPTMPEYYSRFMWVYERLHDNANGYFGPQTGPNAFTIPRHIPEIDPMIINEAPDYGGQSVSETASFWVGLETFYGLINEDWAPYNNAWNRIEQFYIPSAANQPVGTYNVAHPADIIYEQDLPSAYPPDTRIADVPGADPLSDELEATYGNRRVYLMHWLIDVEGAYGFRNGSGETTNVFMNTFQRGKQESSYETIPQCCWNDWTNGGGAYGYEPYFTKGTPVYTGAGAPFDYGKKWSYTNAPDAEVRAIQWASWATKFATEQGTANAVSASTTKAKKMGDYTRYNLFDKYFRQIGNNTVPGTGWNSAHYLINWYMAWGGEIPQGGPSSWGFRVSCSESHQGYQSPVAAYLMATGGGGMIPQSPSAGDMWQNSAYRQLEMIRWLQSPQGPIAGGVTNSVNARYETRTGAAGAGKFYGMDYVYSPVWGDPPSNNWVGFQAWGQGRTADLFLLTSALSNPVDFPLYMRNNSEVILDRLVSWFIKETTIVPGDTTFSIPAALNWVETTAGNGTTHMSTPLQEYPSNSYNTPINVYPRLPNLNWNGTGDHAAFWSGGSVPNPNLRCNITEYTHTNAEIGNRGNPDLGVASSWAYLLIAYAQGKRNLNKFTTPVTMTAPMSDGSTNTHERTHTGEDAFNLAKNMLDIIWNNYRVSVNGAIRGISIVEPRSDYHRMKQPVYVPSAYNSGTMPNGDPINQSSTFISIRSFLQDDPKWTEVQAHITAKETFEQISSPTPEQVNAFKQTIPQLRYHRFWAQAEFAIANAALEKHFGDLLPS